MIPVYEKKDFAELSPAMQKLGRGVNDLINAAKDDGATPSDVLNVLINAVANFSRAVDVDRALVEDAVSSCLDNAAMVDPSVFLKVRP